MDFVLGPVSDFANAYFDDIICGTEGKDGESEESLLLRQVADIRKVLEILKAHRLVLDWKKCVFFARKVEFCGHILENGTRRISPGRFLAMEKWPLPKDVTSLRAFLGYVNHFHQYIREFSELAAPLQEKLKLPHTLAKKAPNIPLNFPRRISSVLKASNNDFVRE